MSIYSPIRGLLTSPCQLESKYNLFQSTTLSVFFLLLVELFENGFNFSLNSVFGSDGTIGETQQVRFIALWHVNSVKVFPWGSTSVSSKLVTLLMSPSFFIVSQNGILSKPNKQFFFFFFFFFNDYQVIWIQLIRPAAITSLTQTVSFVIEDVGLRVRDQRRCTWRQHLRWYWASPFTFDAAQGSYYDRTVCPFDEVVLPPSNVYQCTSTAVTGTRDACNQPEVLIRGFVIEFHLKPIR